MSNELEIFKVNQSELPNIITDQWRDIQGLEDKVKKSVKMAQTAKTSADRAYGKSAGLGHKKEAIESLQEASVDLAESQVQVVEAQQLSFEYQKKLSEITKYLFALGVSNIAANRTVVRELELKLRGASEGELSDLARKEVLSVISQLKAQEDKQKQMSETLKSQDKTISEHQKKAEHHDEVLAKMAQKDKEQDLTLSKHTKKDLEHDRLLAERKQKDKEQDKWLSEQAKKDREHDNLLAERKQKDEEQDKWLSEQAEKDREHDRLLEERKQKDEEQDSKLLEHQESLDVIMERDKSQDKAINKLTDENKKLMKLVEDLTATKSDKKAVPKNKPCKRNNRQISDNTKIAAKQGNAEERPDAGCEIKRWKAAAEMSSFFNIPPDISKADKPQEFEGGTLISR